MKKLKKLDSKIYRINRYIMECKLKSWQKVFDVNAELIDTLWNVNVIIKTNLSDCHD